MNMRVYELFVGPLSSEEKDRYCAEASAIETHLRIPERALPRSVRELEAYIDTMLSTGTIAVTDVAQGLARSVIYPPAPAIAWPVLALMRLVTIGLLPGAIRHAYGFTWSARKQSMLRFFAVVIRHGLPLAPPAIRYWPAARREPSVVRTISAPEP